MLNYPEEAFANRFLAKEKFYNYYGMKSRDKNIFIKDIERITCTYVFQEENMNISAYHDDEKDYDEIEVIEIDLKRESNKIERIAEIIHRIIPYPILLIFKYNAKFLISVAHKRNSKNNPEKVKLTDMEYTPWINEDFLDEFDSRLIDKLAINKLSHENFYKMYSSMVDAVIVTNGERKVGHELTIPVERIREIKDEDFYITQKINDLEAKLKKETQLKKQVSINMELTDFKQQLKKLREELI